MQKLLAISFISMCAAGSAFAASITWNNNLMPAAVGPNGVNLGVTSKSFLDDTNTFSLIANSLDITNMPIAAAIGATVNPLYTTTVNLGYKNEGPGLEHGLGIMTGSDAEIRNGYALQIDLTGITFANVAFTIDSIDGPSEGFRIWGSTTASGTMTLLGQSKFATGGFVQTQSFNTSFKFFEITSDTPNAATDSILLRSVSVNTPEPATFAMLGLGFLALGAARRRKSAVR